MAWPTSSFPTSLDTITNKQDNVDNVIANDINGAYDCIKKIEAKVGVDGSAVATSLDYLLKNASSVDPGHKHSAYAPTASAEQTCPSANNAPVTIAHGLGRIPYYYRAVIRCKTGELGYSAGDEVDITSVYATGLGQCFTTIIADATNIICNVGMTVSPLPIFRKDNGASVSITTAYWKLVIYYI